MSEPRQTRPPNKGESKLLEKYAEAVAGQSALMDGLGKQLITLELAIPGLYATVLKLRQGDEATVTADFWFYLSLFCWILALALAVWSIIPQNYRVDPKKLESGPNDNSDRLSIKEFFRKSAEFKRRRLIGSIIFFGLGIVGAVFVTV